MARRTFLATLGGTAVGAAALSESVAGPVSAESRTVGVQPASSIAKKAIVVQPVLAYALSARREATSWRPWGGLHTEADVSAEAMRIEGELRSIAEAAEFPLKLRPLARVTTREQAAALCAGDADVMLIYAASAGDGEIAALVSPDRHNLMFVRHKSGPVYLWYEIAHPVFLRKWNDGYRQPGLDVHDVVVDKPEDVLWRLRALNAIKNTVGSRIVAIGAASGWGAGGQAAPRLAVEQWKLDIRNVPYEELGKRIAAVKADPQRVLRATSEANEYLGQSGTRLETDRGFVTRSFLLTGAFNDLMAEAEAPAMTVNECMTTIMPMTETTACLSLSVLNDAGYMAFCESDFVVIPSGILLHHIASTPVFLNDPTYPHEGIITLAHCTAPRRMDGKRMEKASILTHFESDYGAAPKVDMRIGQVVTVIDPDFSGKKWLGFSGEVVENPSLDICRSQVDVTIEGDWRRLMEDMCGFHWMLAYGDHMRELEYALRKMKVEWVDVSQGKRSATRA